MSAPVWCADLADQFWNAVGVPPAFPRDLRESAVWFGLVVVELPDLSVTAVCHWLTERLTPIELSEPDRRLRGCLDADGGQAFAFLDATDDAAERRFSLAHEIGHYLRDYWGPRELVKSRLGLSAVDILDGLREPTFEERLSAVLRNVSVGPFSHLMRRDESGRPLTPEERRSEAAADRLAFELLAPAKELDECETRDELMGRLVGEYGLPFEPASRYAALLIPDSPKPEPFVARLLII
jgi:hypothetical protein